MFSLRSRWFSRRVAQRKARQRQQQFTTTALDPCSLCERLEDRRLLSGTIEMPIVASVPANAGAFLSAAAVNGIPQSEFDATGTFTGTLRLRNADDQGRRNYSMTLEIEDQNSAGDSTGKSGSSNAAPPTSPTATSPPRRTGRVT